MSLPSSNTSSNSNRSGGGGGGGVARMPDPRDYAEFEGPLIELAQRSGGDLRKLLTALFGFLHRRTDFYCVTDESNNSSHSSNNNNKSMGFKQGLLWYLGLENLVTLIGKIKHPLICQRPQNSKLWSWKLR